ncbi:hypothetical protein ACH5RR_023518 [Cinchona calisaya]|uniref:Transmembrane protein n=1 Tax=Cinchona calisaya TaxID=153742 RepID=A0ABD2ZAW4_9GENT
MSSSPSLSEALDFSSTLKFSLLAYGVATKQTSHSLCEVAASLEKYCTTVVLPPMELSLTEFVAVLLPAIALELNAVLVTKDCCTVVIASGFSFVVTSIAIGFF